MTDPALTTDEPDASPGDTAARKDDFAAMSEQLARTMLDRCRAALASRRAEREKLRSEIATLVAQEETLRRSVAVYDRQSARTKRDEVSE